MNGRRNKANQDVRLRHDCQEETPVRRTGGFLDAVRTQTHWKSRRDNDLAKGFGDLPSASRFCDPSFDIYTEWRKTIREAVMATLEARSRKIGSRAGALALSGFAGLLVGSFEQLADRSSDCFCISLGVAMDTLPAISLGAWQIAEPYILDHLRVLEGPPPNFRALLEASGGRKVEQSPSPFMRSQVQEIPCRLGWPSSALK
jgi:hypothetical protein